ncbi:FMN-binding negative transcriptional regulator [Phycicoccus endophyticus]|uniref:FMN-binding negative transcriptional regulator n=1 Tax=Phycicoccus endophyticus TaxID=1690220 RepID=A0A7G9QZP7_9MICO|nr:FMN-binding negative transcriptional regulator [Phycicoccus endophyticus]NHI20015.1 FMN-binding negative transcriptional regulator [Phycicoccus endophyticus]QNN48822.1 FMN-binding negative transcriptional regulator [Phycicoccus endophyticus]GGL42587.1 transcriptional regulator [Phycicoccus endophyticus]
MRDNPDYVGGGPRWAADLVREHPWATMVSNGADGAGPVVSHYPFLVEPDEDPDQLVLVSHVGRPDEVAHRLGTQELCVVVYGPSGYISPSWYDLPTGVPTWNFATAHLYGVPEILTDEENLVVLDRLVAHFEAPLPNPFLLRASAENAAYADRLVHGTVGFRLRVTRVVTKEKMSQDKPEEVRGRILAALEGSGPYANRALAARMRAVR